MTSNRKARGNPAERIDILLEQLSDEYRKLPRLENLNLLFREAIARVRIPGGYARRGVAARSLAESLSEAMGGGA